MHGVLDVVEAEEGGHALLLRRLHHLPRKLGGVGERLLAIDMLAGFDCRHGNVEMHVVGCADVDDIDRRVVDDRMPVVDGALIAEGVRGLLGDLQIGVGD